MTETRDFQLQAMQLLEASCLFSFTSYKKKKNTNVGGVSLPAERSKLVGIWSAERNKLDHNVCIARDQLGQQ